LPPNFQQHNLKAGSSTPLFDAKIRNTQGINVWENRAPKPFGSSGNMIFKNQRVANTAKIHKSPLTI